MHHASTLVFGKIANLIKIVINVLAIFYVHFSMPYYITLMLLADIYLANHS